MSDTPTCGVCGKVMTPDSARLRPELFLHDSCLPAELRTTNGGHHVDSLRHPSGQHGLWIEICRLRLLLREGEAIVDQLECLATPDYRVMYERAKEWRGKVNKELR